MALTASYAAPTSKGDVQRVIEVKYAEEFPPTVFLLEGTVVGWSEFEPDVLDFGTVIGGSSVTKEVTVRTREEWPEEKRGAGISLQYATLLSGPSGPKEISYLAEFSPPDVTDYQRYAGEVTLSWAGKEGRELKIPCTARVAPLWLAEPARAFFGFVPRGESRSVKVSMKYQGSEGDPPSLTHSTTGELAKFVNVAYSIINNAVVLNITADTGKCEMLGPKSGDVELHDSKGRLVARIPVVLYVQGKTSS